ERRIPGGEVDEVAAVGQERHGAPPRLAREFADFAAIRRAPGPRAARLREDLDCFAALRVGAVPGARKAAGRAHLRPYPHVQTIAHLYDSANESIIMTP